MQTLDTYRIPWWRKTLLFLRRFFQPKSIYRSQEIRWFFTKDDPGINAWFAQQGKLPSDAVPRTDTYFYLPNMDHSSIKLREGNMELKRRVTPAEMVRLSATVQGIIESWEKLTGKEIPNRVLDDVNTNNNYLRVRVHKRRTGVKVTRNGTADFNVFDISQKLESGCQIEYTALEIQDKQFFTFGIEWFGEAAPQEYAEYLTGVVAECNLPATNSLSYPMFIKQIMMDV
ncbi:hypothetical protein SAMN05444266_102583 [Chitinophaga jiangningensis]|uniref:CYTH domain-containing protein n=1 Tax=Chitinophaga jiangningensis TaxID=1419482 RepID=A0A1M6Z206_9BACT|nr:hypothetical protein [Chitinophaga jiangningensis]SHL24528.1 hypothetical protein SAMN05444266_102583 [Chitinophaga jiangningensis]